AWQHVKVRLEVGVLEDEQAALASGRNMAALDPAVDHLARGPEQLGGIGDGEPTASLASLALAAGNGHACSLALWTERTGDGRGAGDAGVRLAVAVEIAEREHVAEQLRDERRARAEAAALAARAAHAVGADVAQIGAAVA